MGNSGYRFQINFVWKCHVCSVQQNKDWNCDAFISLETFDQSENVN